MENKTYRVTPSKNLRTITYKDKALLYNSLTGNAMVCHKDMLKLIDVIKKGEIIDTLEKTHNYPDLAPVFKRLQSKNLIQTSTASELNVSALTYSKKDINSGSIVNKLRLNVTLSCNMKCSYCYVKTKENDMMSWDTAKKAIDIFFELQRKHGHTFCIIRFFGGEPLLNWPVIKRSLDYIKTIKNRIKVGYVLNTNGTIFSKQIAEKLRLNDVCLAISLDGEEKEHNSFRKLKSGKESYQKIVSNTEKYLKQGCSPGIETTVGDHNIFRLKGLVDLLATLSDKYKKSVPLALQHMAIVSKESIDKTTANKKIEQFTDLFKYAKQKKVPVNTGLSFFPFNSLMGQRPTGIYCRAMAGEICVHPDGDIYPCGALNIKLGTINKIKEVFKSKAYHQLANRRAGNIPACRGCEIEVFCAGGCAADAFAARGMINTSAQNCDLERKLFKELVKQYILASDNI